MKTENMIKGNKQNWAQAKKLAELLNIKPSHARSWLKHNSEFKELLNNPHLTHTTPGVRAMKTKFKSNGTSKGNTNKPPRAGKTVNKQQIATWLHETLEPPESNITDNTQGIASNVLGNVLCAIKTIKEKHKLTTPNIIYCCHLLTRLDNIPERNPTEHAITLPNGSLFSGCASTADVSRGGRATTDNEK